MNDIIAMSWIFCLSVSLILMLYLNYRKNKVIARMTNLIKEYHNCIDKLRKTNGDE